MIAVPPFHRNTKPVIAFTPASIAGLALWLDAGSLALANGDPVSTWTDQSSYAVPFTGVTTTRPTYQTGGQNGQPRVKFVRANNTHVDGGGTLSLPSGATTTFMVVDTGQPAGANYEIVYCNTVVGGDAGTRQFNVLGPSAGNGWNYQRGASSQLINGYFGSGAALLVVIDNAASSSLEVNGASPVTGTLATTPATNQLRIGAAMSVGGVGFNQGLYEKIMYSGQLSGGDITLVKNYLTAKYAI